MQRVAPPGLKDQLVAVDSSQTEEIQLELEKKGDLAEKLKNQCLLGGSEGSIA